MYGDMKVIIVSMEKGGVGKTTFSLNIAIRAAFGKIPNVKKKILFIDLDGQQNSSKTLLKMETVEGTAYSRPPLHPSYDPDDPDCYDWSGRCNSMDLYYDNDVVPYPSILHDRIDVLPSGGQVIYDLNSMSYGSNKEAMEQIYNQLNLFFQDKDVQDMYDLVVVDLPPGKNVITTPAFRACTHAIFPVELEPFGVDGANNIIYEALKENDNREKDINIIGLVPNKVDSRLNIHRAGLRALKNNSHTSKYLSPFIINARTPFKVASIPLKKMDSCTYSDAKCEKEMSLLIDFISHKVYGNEFIGGK